MNAEARQPDRPRSGLFVRVRGRRWPWAVLAASVALALASLAGLRSLPYSKARLEFVGDGGDPSAAGLSWDPAPYEHAPSLAPFRELVAERCALERPVEIAACLSSLFAAAFLHGAPRSELFDPDYDPAADLAAHLAGAPGHCVTRAGLLVTALLATGHPARVAQLVPEDRGGHTVTEVLEPGVGWMVVDPTFGIVQWHHGEPVHAVVQSASEDPTVDWGALLSARRIYPEPWLHARTGPRSPLAPWSPVFAVAGAPTGSIGIPHTLFHGLLLASGLGLLLGLLGLFGRGGRRPVEAPAEGTELAAAE